MRDKNRLVVQWHYNLARETNLICACGEAISALKAFQAALNGLENHRGVETGIDHDL